MHHFVRRKQRRLSLQSRHSFFPLLFKSMCYYHLQGSYTVIHFMYKNLTGRCSRKPLTGQQNGMHNEADANGAIPFVYDCLV